MNEINRYEVVQSSLEEYKTFWISSNESNGFNCPEFFTSLFDEVIYLAIKFDNESIAVIYQSNHIENIKAENAFIQYNGPLWSKSIEKLRYHNQFIHKVNGIRILFDYLSEIGHPINFNLYHIESDIRPYIYFSKQNHSILMNIVPSYTSLIQNLQSKSEDFLLSSYSKDRAKHIRKSLRLGLIITQGDEITKENFVSQYIGLLARKNEMVSATTIDRLRRLFDLSKTYEKLHLLNLTTLEGDSIGYRLLLFDNESCHSILLVLASGFESHASFLTHKSIIYAKNHGAKVFDFNGGNSLVGAYEKHRFGAIGKLYFKINLDFK